MNKGTVILIAVVVIVLGIIIYAVLSANARAEEKKRDQIIALIKFKQSQGEQDAEKKTAWLDAIAGLGQGIGGIFGGPAGSAAAGGAGNAARNLPFFN